MRTVAIIPSRMTSSRLPGKALRPILGEPMLGRLIERLKQTRAIDDVVVATSTMDADDVLVDFARSREVRIYRGSPEDVLERVTRAGTEAEAERSIILMGDSPLVHSALFDDTLAVYDTGAYDYVCSRTPTVRLQGQAGGGEFPTGLWVQVVAHALLERAEREATDPSNREHAMTYFFRRPDLWRLGYLDAAGKWGFAAWPELMLAVNTKEEFDLVNAVFERCYPSDAAFSIDKAIAASREIVKGRPA